MRDYPFEQVAAAAAAMMRQGHVVHQKFTCIGCRSRQTMAKENAFFTIGKCERCNAETNLLATGCNYMMVARVAPAH